MPDEGATEWPKPLALFGSAMTLYDTFVGLLAVCAAAARQVRRGFAGAADTAFTAKPAYLSEA